MMQGKVRVFNNGLAAECTSCRAAIKWMEGIRNSLFKKQLHEFIVAHKRCELKPSQDPLAYPFKMT